MGKVLQTKYPLVLQSWNASAPPYHLIQEWENTGIGIADKIQKLQNRAVIILTFSNYEVRSNVLLDELGSRRLETSRLKQTFYLHVLGA